MYCDFRGKGLGKKEDGNVEVLQIKRREEGQALGAKEQSAAANFQWGDQFWIDVYNKSASKLTQVVNTNKDTKKHKSKKSGDKKKKKAKKVEESEEDDMSDFDLVIEKSSKSLLTANVKPRSRSNSNVKEKKSKEIKKNKDKK